MRELEVKAGKMWASQAAAGSDGCNWRVAVWLECRTAPLGSFTGMPGLASLTLRTGAVTAR